MGSDGLRHQFRKQNVHTALEFDNMDVFLAGSLQPYFTATAPNYRPKIDAQLNELLETP